MDLRSLSGRTCHRNGRGVRTSEPWEGEVSGRERYAPQPRRVRIGHGLLKTRAQGEHNKHLQTTAAHVAPHQSNSRLACILLTALHIGRLFLLLGNVNGHLVRAASFSLFCVPTQHGPGPQPQRPHPAAPAQLREAFSDFLKKYNSPLPSSGKNTRQNSQRLTFKDFWEAPERLSRPRIRQLEDAEIDAVLVSEMLWRDFGLDLCPVSVERRSIIAIGLET